MQDMGASSSARLARQWSTDEVAAAGRLDYWVGAICEAFLEMDCSSRAASTFSGSLTSVAVGPLAFNQVRASTQDVYRTRVGIARGASHPFYLITQRQAPWHVCQGGHRVALRPGDTVLVDSAQPYELHYPEGVDVMSVQLPRPWVGEWLTQVDTPLPRVAYRDQGWGQALSAMGLQFASEPLLATRYPAGLLCDQLGAMLVAALEPAEAPGAVAPAARDLLAKAQALQQAWLDEPGLTAQRVAEHLGVSLRTLHRVYAAGSTSFALHLRRIRLERAGMLLRQPRLVTVSVAEIGRRCGYTDASHFAREFLRLHGVSPSHWRRQHLAG